MKEDNFLAYLQMAIVGFCGIDQAKIINDSARMFQMVMEADKKENIERPKRKYKKRKPKAEKRKPGRPKKNVDKVAN